MQTSRKQANSYQDKIIAELENSSTTTRGYNIWTDFERDILKKYYPTKDVQVIAKVLNRPVQQIRIQVSNMGIKKVGKNHEKIS